MVDKGLKEVGGGQMVESRDFFVEHRLGRLRQSHERLV